MIEVLVSALLVGLIVLGTFSGFDAAGRASADERAHAQATVIAQQDEERLRGLTTAELAQLGTVVRAPITEGSTTFTVTSSARFVTGSTEQFACGVSGGKTDYLQTTSSVTWPSLGKRAPVSQSSIVSVPASAGLQVEVIEQNALGLEGATVTATGAGSQTTPASGCVIFGALSPGTVTVTAKAGGDVDPSGNIPASKEVEISGTALSKVQLQIAPPGSILAEFENNKVAVSGDTFFAGNSKIPTPPDFVGGTVGKFATSTKLEGLFPFKTPSYTVFAGDCEKNNPEVIASPNPIVSGKKEVTDPTAAVTANGEYHAKLEEPEVKGIQVFEGTSTTPGKAVTAPTLAEMVNVECKTTNSQNYTPVPYKHPVTLDASGNLVQKYWPYATKLEFCVVVFKSPKYFKYEGSFANTAKAGTTGPKVYLATVGTGYSQTTTKPEC